MTNCHMDPNIPDERPDPDDYYEDEDDGCYECGGEGWILADCFEDTCCCADPESEHDYYPCPLCNREGKL